MPPLLLLLLILLRPAPGAADGRSMHVSRPPLRSLGFSPTSLRHVPKQRPDSLRIPAPRKASAGARLRLGLVLVSAESGNALVPSVPPQSACPPTGRAARRCRRPCSRPRGSHGASQKSPGMDYNTTTFTITVEKHSRSTAISVTLDRTGTAARALDARGPRGPFARPGREVRTSKEPRVVAAASTGTDGGLQLAPRLLDRSVSRLLRGRAGDRGAGRRVAQHLSSGQHVLFVRGRCRRRLPLRRISRRPAAHWQRRPGAGLSLSHTRALWLSGWLAVWLAGCLAVWLAGWLPGWLAAWLAGWLALSLSLSLSLCLSHFTLAVSLTCGAGTQLQRDGWRGRQLATGGLPAADRAPAERDGERQRETERDGGQRAYRALLPASRRVRLLAAAAARGAAVAALPVLRAGRRDLVSDKHFSVAREPLSLYRGRQRRERERKRERQKETERNRERQRETESTD